MRIRFIKAIGAIIIVVLGVFLLLSLEDAIFPEMFNYSDNYYDSLWTFRYALGIGVIVFFCSSPKEDTKTTEEEEQELDSEERG